MLTLDPITLRERVEELEEENRQLRAFLIPEATLPAHWGIGGGQKRCLLALMGRAPHMAPNELLVKACAPSWRDDPPSLDNVKVRISALRKALAVHVPGVTITTVWGEGYTLDAESAGLLKKAIGRDLARLTAEAA